MGRPSGVAGRAEMGEHRIGGPAAGYHRALDRRRVAVVAGDEQPVAEVDGLTEVVSGGSIAGSAYGIGYRGDVLPACRGGAVQVGEMPARTRRSASVPPWAPRAEADTSARRRRAYDGAAWVGTTVLSTGPAPRPSTISTPSPPVRCEGSPSAT